MPVRLIVQGTPNTVTGMLILPTVPVPLKLPLVKSPPGAVVACTIIRQPGWLPTQELVSHSEKGAGELPLRVGAHPMRSLTLARAASRNSSLVVACSQHSAKPLWATRSPAPAMTGKPAQVRVNSEESRRWDGCTRRSPGAGGVLIALVGLNDAGVFGLPSDSGTEAPGSTARPNRWKCC